MEYELNMEYPSPPKKNLPHLCRQRDDTAGSAGGSGAWRWNSLPGEMPGEMPWKWWENGKNDWKSRKPKRDE